MTRRAVLVCPGRGTYNKPELGYLARHHADKSDLLDAFEAIRAEEGQESLRALDGAERFSSSRHTAGDAASPLIYAASYLDAQSLAEDIEIVAVTGNSMGWYIALACAGALSPEDGFRVVNTMGRLMQQHGTGGQLVYPCTGDDWRPDPAPRSQIIETIREIDGQDGAALRLSIDLGGMLVLAGDAAGLTAFETAMPRIEDRYPMRLPNHAAFHTDLVAPVAEKGRAALPATMFRQPALPLIDGRGAVWWPHATDTGALWDYTLGHQVTQAYDFARAIRNATLEFAPDLFLVTGPGATLSGAVAQSLVGCGWRGMRDKAAFKAHQAEDPALLAMGGPEDQRALATKPA